jgi:hypothetical protein
VIQSIMVDIPPIWDEPTGFETNWV